MDTSEPSKAQTATNATGGCGPWGSLKPSDVKALNSHLVSKKPRSKHPFLLHNLKTQPTPDPPGGLKWVFLSWEEIGPSRKLRDPEVETATLDCLNEDLGGLRPQPSAVPAPRHKTFLWPNDWVGYPSNNYTFKSSINIQTLVLPFVPKKKCLHQPLSKCFNLRESNPLPLQSSWFSTWYILNCTPNSHRDGALICIYIYIQLYNHVIMCIHHETIWE